MFIRDVIIGLERAYFLSKDDILNLYKLVVVCNFTSCEEDLGPCEIIIYNVYSQK